MRPSEIAEAIHDCIDMQLSPFIWGPPGIGKSETVAQCVEDRKIELRDVRMGQMDVTDVKGFPSPDPVKKLMHWLPPDFLPTKGKGFLFLDEINSAPPAVQASCYQLILNRAVGSYKVPPGWAIGAAGNRESDRAVVHRTSTALNSRMIHLDYEVSHEDWKDHARKNGIHEDRIGFISFRPGLLHNFDPGSKSPAYPCPRTWFFVDKIERQREHRPRNVTRGLIQGAIGEGAAREYEAYIGCKGELPTLEEIKASPTTAKMPKSPAAQYAAVTMLMMSTTAVTFDTFMQYIVRLPREMQAVYVRDCMRAEPAVKHTPTFNTWSRENHEVLV